MEYITESECYINNVLWLLLHVHSTDAKAGNACQKKTLGLS